MRMISMNRKGCAHMRQQLADLRRAMAEQGVSWVLVPTDDFHASEYVGQFFKSRTWLTGFTGSAGVALVSQDWAGLWTDGRYFLQAGMQLQGSGFELMKMGETGVPTIPEYLKDHLASGDVLSFDGRTVTARQAAAYRRLTQEAGATLRTDLDLVGSVWTDRPALSAEPVFELPLSYTGKARADKLAQIRGMMQAEKADALVLSSLMDICWLMNIRGNDVACTPVVLSYLILTLNEARLFINPAVLSDEIRAHLEADGVTIEPYDGILDAVAALPENIRVWADLQSVSSAIQDALPASADILDKPNPTLLPKACKNETEVRNFREAHVKDGVAVTRLIMWLKQNVGKLPITELSAAEKLEELRRAQDGYIEPSFSPIIGYGPHGAIIHYGATPESNAPLEPRSFVLADTGGHYLEGTTDITRTIVLGPLTREEQEMYTLVLRSHLELGGVRFKYGCSGVNLDYVARAPFWARGLDYNHGTGHGVGYVLGVHEGPQSFRWRAADMTNVPALEPGMITSDEPGIYLEGKFGIRIENLTVVCESESTDFGRFLHLEHLTMAPYDLDAVLPELLTEEDRRLLNAYHGQVREALTPRLTPEEAAWLAEATRPI